MKDKHNIILILVSSNDFNSSSGVAHDINSFSLVFLSFFSGVPSFLKYLFVLLHLNLGKVIILFFSTLISLHHSFVYGGPSWWFFNDLIHSQSILQDSSWRGSSIIRLAFICAIVLSLSFEVVL